MGPAVEFVEGYDDLEDDMARAARTVRILGPGLNVGPCAMARHGPFPRKDAAPAGGRLG